MLLRQPGDVNIQAVITIHGQREFPVPTEGVPHVLILQFDDTEAQSATDPIQAASVRWRQREAARIGLNLTPPTREHARQIIEFARTISDIEGTLLCQCLGGVSRSSAAALLCLVTWARPDHADECLRHLLETRACAMPHPDLVAFGDELLACDGRLVAALKNINAKRGPSDTLN